MSTSSERTAGVTVATVTDNDDPEELGRVRLDLPGREEESGWARVAAPMAGNDYGTYYLPEVGEEVLVSFAGGDPTRPFVLGGLWSRQSPPPEDNDGDNDVRTIRSRSGHELRFDDDAATGRVEIETSAGHSIVLDDASGSETVRIEDSSGENSVELDGANGEVAIDAASKLSLSAPEIEIDGTKSVDVSAEGEVNVSGKAKTSVSGKGELRLDSDGLGKVDVSGPLQLKGAIIQLN